MSPAGRILLGHGRPTPWGCALVLGVIATAVSCGISSIAPYNPDGGTHAGSGGASAGTGGNPVATGGAGQSSSGGAGGTPATSGSGGLASGGRGGQIAAASGGSAGQAVSATGGRGGQIGTATGGTSGRGAGGSSAGRGGTSGSSGGSGMGGGAAPACLTGAGRCTENDVQVCTDSQWGTRYPCDSHQTCQEDSGVAQCLCKADAVCSALTDACTSTSLFALCAQDNNGCFYAAGSSMCTTGTCNVAGGGASCCTCTASGPACVGRSSQTCALGIVCGRMAPNICTDMNWAEWPMPNGPTDVSNGAANAASYTDNGDGTITDKVTALMWEKGSSGPYASWSQARAHCPTLTVGGYKDWRLPTRIELLSLVDYSILGSATTPMINTKYFPATLSAYYWTSTPRPGFSSSEAWIVNFYQGGGGYNPVTLSSGYAMCVR